MRVVFFHVILRCRAPRAHGRFLEKGMRTTTEDLKLANLQKLVKDVEQLLSGVTIQEPPKPAPRDGGYTMDHSAIIYLMGRDGRFLKHFTYTTDARGLAEGIHEAMRNSP